MGTDLPPSPDVWSYPLEQLRTQQGVLRFSGQKISQGFQVSGPVSLAFGKLLSPKWPIKNLLLQRVSVFDLRDAGASWEMELHLAIFPLFVGELQRPEFFSLTCLGAGCQAANQQSDKQPDAGR